MPVTGVVGVAGITVANRADNVAVFVPFFALAGAGGMPVVPAVFAAGVALSCAAGRWLGTRPVVERAVERHGAVVVPLVLIALGVAILAGAAG